MTKLETGDIFEIPTKLGLCYAQFTHDHPTHTSVLRVFKTKHNDRPGDFSEVAMDEVEFTVLFPIAQAARKQLLQRVGHAPVRKELQPFPVFRSGIPHRDTKVVETWWLWDGETETRIGPTLSEDQRKLPRFGILNLGGLVGLIEGDTHPSLL
jgi:hypothetical protein